MQLLTRSPRTISSSVLPSIVSCFPLPGDTASRPIRHQISPKRHCSVISLTLIDKVLQSSLSRIICLCQNLFLIHINFWKFLMTSVRTNPGKYKYCMCSKNGTSRNLALKNYQVKRFLGRKATSFPKRKPLSCDSYSWIL